MTIYFGDGSSQAIAAGSGLFSSYAILQYRVSSGSHGGASTTSWTTRALNTEVADPDGIVSLSSDQFTLAAGSYYITATYNAYDAAYCRTRIYDITNSAEVIHGQNGAGGTTGYAYGIPSEIAGRFTAAGSAAYEFQQNSASNASPCGHGCAISRGGDEIFTTLTIFKES